MSVNNITKCLLSASTDAYEQGLSAYQGYHDTLRVTASKNGLDFKRVVSAFAALSPGNKLEHNFKDLDTLISAVQRNKEVSEIRLHCYPACTQRAYDYLTGWEVFTLGKWNNKTWNFFNNILTPESPDYVTIDRHAIEVWHGYEVEDKDRKRFFNAKGYNYIADAYKKVAKNVGLTPNQVQAITWYAWKERG
jgi:hypothetical protein